MKPHFPKDFEHNYQNHLKRLKLKGMQPKTIEAYSRAVRRAGARFENQWQNHGERINGRESMVTFSHIFSILALLATVQSPFLG